MASTGVNQQFNGVDASEYECPNPFSDQSQTEHELSRSAIVTELHTSLLIILPPIVHYRNVTFQGQDFPTQEAASSLEGGRPSTPPCSLTASALIQEQDVLLQSYRHLKANYYLSPYTDTVHGTCKNHDKLSLTKSEQELSRDEEDEVICLHETDVSDSDCDNLEVVWTPELPINSKHYNNNSAVTIDVSKGKTEHHNVDSLLLIDALQTEFKVPSCRTESWVVV